MKQQKELYIIHGWAYSVEPWQKTIKILTEKYHYRIHTLHVPGLTDPSKKVWTIGEYVKWADSMIPDHSIALGHSNGGRILMNLCIKKPTKLSQLILLDSAGIYEESFKRDCLRLISKLFSPLKKLRMLRKIIHKIIGASDYDRAPDNMKKTLANMLDSDKKLDPSKITVKTNILWGEADNVTPPRQAYKLHHLIQGSTLDIHDSWTHAPYISHPVELAKVINLVIEESEKSQRIKGKEE